MYQIRKSINPKTGDRHVRLYTGEPRLQFGGNQPPHVEIVFSQDLPPYINQIGNQRMLSALGAGIQAHMLSEAVQIIAQSDVDQPPTYPYEDFIEWGIDGEEVDTRTIPEIAERNAQALFDRIADGLTAQDHAVLEQGLGNINEEIERAFDDYSSAVEDDEPDEDED